MHKLKLIVLLLITLRDDFWSICTAVILPAADDTSASQRLVRRQRERSAILPHSTIELDFGTHAKALASDGKRRNSYRELVMEDGAEVFYPLDDSNTAATASAYSYLCTTLCSDGTCCSGNEQRLSALDGTVEGSPQFGSSALIDSEVNTGTAVLFTSASRDSRQVIKIPSSPAINQGKFTARTVEFWFNAGPLTTTSNQTLYMEGDEDVGIHIFAHKKEGFQLWDNGPAYLYFFVWNRDPDAEAMWALGGSTESIDYEPIRCDIREGDKYYVALVFEGGSVAQPNYKAFIKQGSGAGYTATKCGPTMNLPPKAELTGHAAACIGAICGTTRHNTSTTVHAPTDSTPLYLQVADCFHGTIDALGIYNKALNQTMMDNHIGEAVR